MTTIREEEILAKSVRNSSRSFPESFPAANSLAIFVSINFDNFFLIHTQENQMIQPTAMHDRSHLCS